MIAFDTLSVSHSHSPTQILATLFAKLNVEPGVHYLLQRLPATNQHSHVCSLCIQPILDFICYYCLGKVFNLLAML